MSTTHAVTCPVCHAALLIENRDSIGGQVIPNLVVLDSAKETPETTRARVAMEAAQIKVDDAATARDKAQGALDAAAAATPIDDAKVAKASADLTAAQAALTAAEAELDLAVEAYEEARIQPLPPQAGTLSPDGKWEWDGTKWVLLPPQPPPLPAGFEAAEEPGETAATEVAEEPVVSANG